MITQFRVGLKLQRFELIAAAAAVLVLAISAILVRARLDAIGVTPACWASWFGAEGAGACSPAGVAGPEALGPASIFLAINESEGGKVMAAMALLPLAVGVFLGVSLVAREIETGTAPTIWALARSRARWLLGRLLPPLVIATVLLAILSVAAEVLWAGRAPWEPGVRFEDAGLHGPVILAKGLAAFGLALLAGAIIGRSLPAVIVAAALALVLYLGAQTAYAMWLRQEAPHHVVVVDPNASSIDEAFPGGTNLSQGWLTSDGRFIEDYEATLLVPEGTDPYEWLYANLTPAMTGVPGSLYPVWAGLEVAGFGVVALGAIGASFLVVGRRRPM